MKGKKKEILTASAVLLQKFATALANVAWLVLLAELIDEVLPQKVIMRSQEKMAQYVLDYPDDAQAMREYEFLKTRTAAAEQTEGEQQEAPESNESGGAPS